MRICGCAGLARMGNCMGEVRPSVSVGCASLAISRAVTGLFQLVRSSLTIAVLNRFGLYFRERPQGLLTSVSCGPPDRKLVQLPIYQEISRRL